VNFGIAIFHHLFNFILLFFTVMYWLDIYLAYHSVEHILMLMLAHIWSVKYPSYYQSPIEKSFQHAVVCYHQSALFVHQYTAVALAKQFFTTLVAKLRVVSVFKLEDSFPGHTSLQIMNSKSVERTF
jgi:hypothetical protein